MLCYKEVRGFYKFDIPDFQISFLTSRLSYDKALGRDTQTWEVANAYNNKITCLSPSVWIKESSHKPEEFSGVIKHEIAHLFNDRLSKQHPMPRWLDEGVADFIAKHEHNHNDKWLYLEDNFCQKLDTPQNWDQRTRYGAYTIANVFVRFLIKKFTFTKIKKIIQHTPAVYTYKQFDSVIEKNLGAKLARLEKKFIAQLIK